MLRRVAAAQATLDRFKDQPFRWGAFDCAKLVAFHMREMGYALGIGKAGSYRSALGAQRALRRLGATSLNDLPERYGLPEIPPAAAVVGDLIELPGEGDLGTLAVAVGNGRVIGYHQDAAGATVLQPVQFVTAWRVEPL